MLTSIIVGLLNFTLETADNNTEYTAHTNTIGFITFSKLTK